MDLKGMGLDADIYNKLKSIANGEDVGFTSTELEKIKHTVTSGRGGGKLAHLADTTRKKYDSVDKMIFNSKKDRNNTSDFNKLSASEQSAIEEEYKRAEKTRNEYRQLIKDLKKISSGKAKTKDIKSLAQSIVDNLKKKKNKVTTSFNEMMKRRQKDRTQKLNIGFMAGLISDDEIDELLKALGLDRQWYYRQVNLYKSIGYPSDEFIEMIKADIGNIAVERVHEICVGETFTNEDGTKMNNDEIRNKMIELGVSKIIVKFLELVDNTEFMKNQEKQGEKILNMYENWQDYDD